MKISLFTVCRNRENNLKLSIPSWKKQNVDEIIILDYGSDNPIKGSYRVEADKFQITKAFNIAESICTGDILIKVDCDYILNVNIVENANLQTREFYTGAHTKESLDGFLICWRKDFETINGYNERLVYYGYDDTDLYNRLEGIGIIHKKINPKWITHISHSDKDRLKEYKVDGRRDLSRHLNYYLNKNKVVSEIEPWTLNDVRSRYV